MMCRLLGSGSASLGTGARREFCAAFSHPPELCPFLFCLERERERAARLMIAQFFFYSAQFVPQVSEDSSVQVINFCRTPQWYVARVSSKFLALSHRRTCGG